MSQNHMEQKSTKMSKWIRETLMVDEITPEEYAGRFSHTLVCLGFQYTDHQDDELEEWLCELRSILDDPSRLGELRRQYLTTEEIEAIENGLDEV